VQLLSMQTFLLISIGVCLYVAFFHYGMRRAGAAHAWLAAWALAAAGFAAARIVQLELPEYANAATRCAAAIGTQFVWTLLRFTSELTETPRSPRLLRSFGVASFAFAALALFSPWILTGEIVERESYLGTTYHGSVAGPLMPLFAAYLLGTEGWITWRLARATNLAPLERRTLIVALVIYAAMCATNVAATLGLPVAPIGEFAPAVVAIGASRLVARRQGRLESDLEALVAQKTAQLVENEARYRGLVESSKVGIVCIDRAGKVLTVTPRIYEMFELPVGSSEPGASLQDLPLTRDNGAAALVKSVIERAKAISAETRQATTRGRNIDVHFIVAPQRDSAGEVAGALMLLEDVTERRAIEARLRQSQKMESVGELAGGIARGITAPMESVRDNLARVRSACDDVRKQLAPSATEEQRERFSEIEQLVDEAAEGVQRALGIVSDMREISSGGSLAIAPVDLNQLLAGVARMAGTQRRGAQLVERYAEIPLVTGNSGQLRQVFLNLIVNAVQAAPERGHVWIETQRDGDCVRVRVSDDGAGISPQHRDRLFEPFFTTKPAGQGTGLGLFLSYQIVQKHGGEIRFRADAAEGATFEVSLPIEPRAGAAGAQP